MKTLYNDIASALVTVTFAISVISTLVSVLGGGA